MLQKGFVTQSFHIWLFMLLRAHVILPSPYAHIHTPLDKGH